ncbi:BatD family protein [Falsigemmobacter faecalis]|uniref:Protein BatD n=1 Tax=Falsigemmobacter faecalis TaxID=2488730 RepID=A0A3P3DI84_9RHOB|nr:BatD family protein [Falsigemmobacter faecalis]RRH72328.1 hypothetical protein EG244_15225 [Falsigemmobacter faecalis]
MVIRLLLALLLLWPLTARAEGEFSLKFLLAEPVDRPVVGQMIPVILRGRYDRHIAGEKLVLPPSDTFDWIQTKADEWFEERIDGKNWMILQRHLAIWPRHDGVLQFGPAEHQLTIITRAGQRATASVKAEPLVVSVAPHPDPRMNGWKFAARAVEIEDSLSGDPARLPDGEAVTRRVTLRALGSLPEHLPPRPLISEPWLITFSAPVRREMRRTPEGPVSEVVWEWQFRPEHGEPGVLEPIIIPWFDTVNHRMSSVEIPSITIGYASYYTGQNVTGRLPGSLKWGLAGAVLAGLVAGAVLALLRFDALRPGTGLTDRLRRFDPRRWLALWQAKRRGDLLTERRLAEELNLPPARRAALDRRIYGRGQV